jgi:stringent starvation protein B
MNDVPRQPTPKIEAALKLLEESSVFVHLDPRKAGVNVPKWFANEPQLILQIGLNMAIPIPDLKVDEDGIRCTLSFNRSPFYCILPWSAIYALVGEAQNDRPAPSFIWADDVPPELTAQARNARGQRAPQPKRPRPKPALAISPSPDDDSPPSEAKTDPPKAAPALAMSEPLSTGAPASERGKSEPPSVGGAGKKPKRELPPYLRVIK